MQRSVLVMAATIVCVFLGAGITGFAQKNDDPRRKQDPGYIVNGLSPSKKGDVRFLTGPSQGAPLDIAMTYLRQNTRQLGLTAADLSDVFVTEQYTDVHNGVTHIYLRQVYKGVEVSNGDLTINIAADGSVINVGHSMVTNLAAAINRQSPTLDAFQSLGSAARHLGLKIVGPLDTLRQPEGLNQKMLLDTAGISMEPIPAKLVYQPVGKNSVRLAWLLEIHELSGDHAWNIAIDAESGEMLALTDNVDHDNWGSPAAILSAGPIQTPRKIRVRSMPATLFSFVNDGSSYNVFPLPFESPSDGSRTLVTNPAHSIASPFGWHDTNGATGPEFTRTRGNNVHAYTDIDANNVADPGSDPDGGPGLTFDFPLDLTQNPSAYRPAAVVNLFYWNNIVHDVFYGYGFNEVSGNFQVNNYGRGPTTAPLGANDDVRAEAQDGSGTNNANFLTGTDGNRPRMQMYVWNNPFVNLVTVNPSSPIAGDYAATNAAFGPQLTLTGITADVVLALDPANPAGPSETDACSPLTNASEVSGKIAIVDRGTCPFVDKVINAQNAGAVAVIVVNNIDGSPVVVGGTSAAVTIPTVMVSLAVGNQFKDNLPFNATLRNGGGTIPNRDSDFDNGVIVHEYGHGISNRLTGGRNNASALNNAEQMGEGWSDWLGLVLTTHPDDTPTTRRGIGTYVSFQPADGNGIRPTPYTTDMTVNPSTYDSIKDTATISQPHGIGYVWATMLWEVYWNLVNKHGYNPDVYGNWSTGGNNLAIQLVMDGMKLQPTQPGFVTGRNAILQADVVLTGGANQCEIWQGFAKRGLGVSANQGSSNNRSDGTQAFNLPPACVPTLSLGNPAATQYSDPVTLNAAVTPALFSGLQVTGSVEFFINGVSVGSSGLDGSGNASITVSNDRAAGDYNVTATFTPTGPAGVGPSSAGPVTLTVLKENAETFYTGDQFVTTAGPNINTALVAVSANLIEESDGNSGDISLAKAVFEFFRSTNMGSTPDVTVGNVDVDPAGNAVTTVVLAADVWTVKVRVDPGNGYWVASPVGMDVITVAVGSNESRVAGGGWVSDAASANGKGNFGFNVSPMKNNGNLKGNSVFVFRGTDGFDYVVKSTSWQGGNLTFIGGSPLMRARFNGRATVQKINPLTGVVVDSFGNYSFTVEIRDGDIPTPHVSDGYGITVLTNGGVLWHQVGGINSPVDVGGGNIAIKAN